MHHNGDEPQRNESTRGCWRPIIAAPSSCGRSEVAEIVAIDDEHFGVAIRRQLSDMPNLWE